jgi:DNA-binding LacI/PurR family transcriptional regulator
MPHKRPPTIQDQVLNTLREGLRSRRWAGVLPGGRQLAKELGVSRGTLQGALKRLEAEGLLAGKGARFSREVAPSAAAPNAPLTLRVGVLTDEPMSAENAQNLMVMTGISHALEAGGHLVFFAPRSMRALRGDTASIRMMMTNCAADAWIVVNGGRPLLESLTADFPVPVLVWGGPVEGLDIAAVGVSIRKSLSESVRRLTVLGHKRIVLAVPPQDRTPVPSPWVHLFNDELAAAGIKPGRYHVPDWELTGDGFNELLRSLFAITPPTALLVDDVRQLCAVYAFLAARRMSSRDLALVFFGADPTLDWMSPAPIRIEYDNDAIIRRVASWADTVAAGGRDTAQVRCEAKLTGGEFMPPPKA